MALSVDTINELARELNIAEKSRVQITQFSKRFPEMTLVDGYAIQKAWVAQKCAEGRKIVGHKIGLTSRAMQLAAQISEPDFGALLDDMMFAAGVDIPIDRFVLPMVEVELAFVLNAGLTGPDVAISDVLAATEYVVPAIEIIDARIERIDRLTKTPRKVFDTISDNAANAGVVLGATTTAVDAVDLRWTGAIMEKNGIVEETGLAAGVLGHPAAGIAWLANKLALHGESLVPGELLLAGSFTRPVSAARGDTFSVDYGRVLGKIEFRFT